MNHSLTRKIALDILMRQQQKGAFLTSALRRYASDRRVNFPLLQKLVKGTSQWREVLDSTVTKLFPASERALSAESRILFMLATYQVLFFERTDVARVQRETKSLVKGVSEGALKTFFERLRTEDKPSFHKHATTPVELAAAYGHPRWLIERWVRSLGLEETRALCEVNNRPWPVGLRVNTLRATPRQVHAELRELRVPFQTSSYSKISLTLGRLPKKLRLHQLPAFRSGHMQVQDTSSTLVAELLNPRPGDSVLDLCAAPGGKATHLAAIMKNRGQILAVDLYADRLKLVQQNAKRLGIGIIKTLAADARQLRTSFAAKRVLLDAPCSGFGTLGRKVEVRWTKDESTLHELCALQAELLESAARLTQPGGFLVYSTCTLLPEENELQVHAFLQRHSEFSLCHPPKHFPKELITDEGFFSSWPHRHGIGGAFAALMRKTSASQL